MKARDVMTSNPSVVTPDEPVTRAAELMRDENVGIIPVVDDRSSMRLRGVITDRDIAVRHVAGKHGADCPIRDDFSTGIETVQPDADMKDVTDMMARHQVRRVPVVEPGARLVGIIAQADVAMEDRNKDQVGKLVEKISEPGKRRA